MSKANEFEYHDQTPDRGATNVQWVRAFLTPTGPGRYDLRLEADDGRWGEGRIELDDEPPPSWVDVCRAVQAEYRVVVEIDLGPGADPRRVRFTL